MTFSNHQYKFGKLLKVPPPPLKKKIRLQVQSKLTLCFGDIFRFSYKMLLGKSDRKYD